MKTLEIKDLLKKEIMLIELPEIIESDYSLIHGRNPEETYLSFHKRAAFREPRKDEKLADGIWTPIGKPSEIREEDARELVEPPIDKWGDDKFRFLDYRYDGYYDLFTATESLLSAIESVVQWENPVSLEREKVYRQIGNTFTADGILKCWHEAEHRTFDRNRSIILVKN